jgi:hypothetical protein
MPEGSCTQATHPPGTMPWKATTAVREPMELKSEGTRFN